MTSRLRDRRAWSAWVLALLLGGLALAATLGGAPDGPSSATAQGSRFDVLVFSRTTGFRHTEAINAGHAAFDDLATAGGFSVTHSEDATDFTDHNLRNYEVVVFLHTDGEGILNQRQRAAFERWNQRGGGSVRIHADANADRNWEWKNDLQGGALFDNHPSGANQFQEATVEVEDPTHPATANVPDPWVRTDEWYNFTAEPRGQVHVLLTLDESTYEEEDGSPEADDHPIAWCSIYDGGRNFYTALGHGPPGDHWDEPAYLDHISGALEWAAGEEPGDCGPARAGLPTEASLTKVTLDDGSADVGGDDTGPDTENPMELAVASDGRVFFVEIGAGALDSFNSAVKMYDPASDETYVVGEIPVFRRKEDGLLGIALDPNFDTNNFIYLFYSVPGPQLEPGTQRISRFTFDPAAGEVGMLDPASEVPLLEFPNQRLVCCHSAGSLAFGPDGNLYSTTGDDTTPFETNGYAPIDARNCGPGDADGCNPGTWPADAQHAYDARRTSGNSNDLRGKLIRIDPIEAATPEDEPGIGSTYEIPEGNLFPVGTADTRPEIYAMGFRNPFRLSVDPETGHAYVGQVGPDANSDCFPANGGGCAANPRGPRGYDTINQVREAGNFGWPYCLAGQGYYQYDYATGTSGEQYDCENGPTNDSPHNTGIDTLPPVTDPLIWYPYGSSPEFPEIPPGGARTAMAGPVYHFDPALDSDVKLSEYFDDKLIWADWSRNLMLATTLDSNGDYVTTEEFMPNEEFRHPHDIEVGPDGALYIIEWGNAFNFAAQGINPDSGLYRIEQRLGGLPALASAQADPTTGQAPLEVQFTGELSDRGADDPPTYEWDFGDGSPTSTEVNPTHTYAEPGTYVATLTVTDAAGESTDTVTINALGEGPGCGPPFSDEFEGTELDTERWEVIRRDDTQLSVAGGALNIVADNTDIFQGEAGLPNIVVQPLPGGGVGPWSITTELTWEPRQNFRNAGLIIYTDDDNYIKTGMVWNQGGVVDGRTFELIKETAGGADFEGTLDPGDGMVPNQFFLRYVSEAGDDVTSQFSTNGEMWTTIGQSNLSGITNPRIGVYATASTQNQTQPESTASFHSVTVEPDREPCPVDDTIPPETDVLLNGAEPVASYAGPVEVTLAATDGTGEEATGVASTEYSTDGGEPVVAENTAGDDPFVTEFTVSGNGEHTVEFHSADNADPANVEETQSVTFEIGPTGPPALDGSVTPRRDSVKPGKQARFRLRVANVGDSVARNVELCVRAPKRKVSVVGPDCREAPNLGVDASTQAQFALKPKRSAAGDRVTLRFTVDAANAGKEAVTATLKVKRNRRR
jgi:glucose/arabinose dehydrogenase/PKD repeat protein/type 1 glutamine amidotransferase